MTGLYLFQKLLVDKDCLFLCGGVCAVAQLRLLIGSGNPLGDEDWDSM